MVGVVKGGTTSLHHYLSSHPDIYLPPIKETNHFSKKDIRKEFFMNAYARDVDIDLDRYFRAGMPKPLHIAHVNRPDHYSELFSKVSNEISVGEISNSYMICPSAAKSIYDFNPHAKILMILRNPISRAWSQYLMNIREAKNTYNDFIEEVTADDSSQPKGWGINHQYLELGKYAEQVSRYIELFGRKNVLAIFYEEYRSNPKSVLSTICSFLGVNSDFNFDFSDKRNASSLPRNAVLNRFLVHSGVLNKLKRTIPGPVRRKIMPLLYSNANIPEITTSSEEWLQNYYLDDVRALEELLATDVTKQWPQFK